MRILTYWITFLSLVHTFALKENIALNKDTMQSSYYPWTGSSLANDGNREQNESPGDYPLICSHTLEDQTDYWWAVDLGQEYNINTITIYNREDCCDFRLTDFEIFIYNSSISNWTNFDQEQEQLCFFHKGAAPSVLSIACNRIIRGRYIKIYKKYHYFPDGDALTLCEVEVFADQNPNEGFYCKQINKLPMMNVQMNLTNFTDVRCASSCRNINSCLGFTMALDRTCSLYQTRFYCKQINKQPMMKVQMNLTNFTDARCAISCRHIDSCLGFTMTSDGTCSLFQTSKYLPSGNNDSEYFEKC